MKLKSIAVTGVAAACLALGACGGGGGGGGFPVFPQVLPPPPPPPPAPPPPGPAPEPESSVRVVMYEMLKFPDSEEDIDELMRQFNAQGARGYRFLAPGEAGDQEESVSVYVKDSQTTYSYERVESARNVAELREQLRVQGLRGYRPFMRDLGIYYKDNAAATTYSYIVADGVAVSTADALLTELNAKGVNGYYADLLEERIGGSRIRIFEKDDKSSAVYAYAFLDKPAGTGMDAYLAQLNAQGAQGFRYRNNLSFTDGKKFIYEKDAAQSAKFSFYDVPSDDGLDMGKLIARASEEGKKGAGLAEAHGEGQVYFMASDCKGRLCVTRPQF